MQIWDSEGLGYSGTAISWPGTALALHKRKQTAHSPSPQKQARKTRRSCSWVATQILRSKNEVVRCHSNSGSSPNLTLPLSCNWWGDSGRAISILAAGVTEPPAFLCPADTWRRGDEGTNFDGHELLSTLCSRSWSPDKTSASLRAK